MDELTKIRTSCKSKTILCLKISQGWFLGIPHCLLLGLMGYLSFCLFYGLRTSTNNNVQTYLLIIGIIIVVIHLYPSFLLYDCFSRPTQGKLQNSTIVLNRRVIVTERMLRSNNFVVERQPILYIKESRRCFKIGQSWYSSFIVPKECLSHEQKDAIRRLKTKIKSEKKR